MTVKEKIIGTLRATGRENIEQVIEYMGNNGFFTKSCHRHHHYRGGLADHAWQTYQIAPCKTTPMALTSRASPFALCCTTFATVAE